MSDSFMRRCKVAGQRRHGIAASVSGYIADKSLVRQLRLQQQYELWSSVYRTVSLRGSCFMYLSSLSRQGAFWAMLGGLRLPRRHAAHVPSIWYQGAVLQCQMIAPCHLVMYSLFTRWTDVLADSRSKPLGAWLSRLEATQAALQSACIIHDHGNILRDGAYRGNVFSTRNPSLQRLQCVD
jgi:hypothetical protein